MNLVTLFLHRAWPVWTLIFTIVLASCASAAPPVTDTPQVDSTQLPVRTATATRAPEVIPTQQTPAYLTLDPEDLAGISVRFAHSWTGDGAIALEKIATEFSLTNPWDIGVEVEAYGSETAMIEAIQADLDTGDAPGLIAAHPYQLSALGGDYFSANLTNYFTDLVWGFDDNARADIPPVLLEQFTADGNLMALPVAPQATVLFYNQTWADALGFSSTPVDEQDFRDQSSAATFANLADENEANDNVGGWLVNFDPNVLLSWYRAFGGRLTMGEVPEFNNDAGQTAFSYLKLVYDLGFFWKARQPEPYFYFANRYALMVTGTLDQIPAHMGWFEVAGNEDEWTTMGFPGPAGEVMLVDGPGLTVTVDSPEKQMAAWLFARHLLEPDVQAKLVRSMFTIPVRGSTMESLDDFSEDYPQWAQGVNMIEIADAVPISDGWGLAQWVLQDAIYRLFQPEAGKLTTILEELDDMILELEEMTP